MLLLHHLALENAALALLLRHLALENAEPDRFSPEASRARFWHSAGLSVGDRSLFKFHKKTGPLPALRPPGLDSGIPIPQVTLAKATLAVQALYFAAQALPLLLRGTGHDGPAARAP